MEDEETSADTPPPSNKSLVAGHEDDGYNKNAAGHNQRQLLSKQPSEVEDNNTTDESRLESRRKEVGNEEIIKELKNVQRQNSITHYLLTGLIVITLAWQFSEFSLMWKIKDGLSNPLKSVGGIFKGMFQNRREYNVQDVMKQASEMHKQVTEPTYSPGLKIPELPHLDFPGFDSSDDEDD